MVTIENTAFKAVIDQQDSRMIAAVKAGTSEETLKKIYDGESGLQLKNVGDIADKLGLDVVVSFKKKANG